VVRVISEKSETDAPRRPGVVGLNFLIAIYFPLADVGKDVDGYGLQSDDCPL
jgi:hypothetical protein